jgi:hypothetical protein
MNQILHIFKKDAVRHWPEILISLTLLGFSTRHELLYPWQNSRALYSPSPTFSSLTSRYITPATFLFWVFLCVRVVQDESLVGDRQWWVTKPYEWWNLLAAKFLFIFIFISVPLFHVQLLLLHQFGFPILPNLPALLLSQVALYFLPFLPALFLASLTKDFGQFLLAVGCILAGGFGIAWLDSNAPSGYMETPLPIVESFHTILLWGSFLVILGWQCARRRRWVSAAMLLGMLAVNSLISVVAPNAKTIEKNYARVEAQTFPAKIAVMQPTERNGRRNSRLSADAASYMNLNVPITVTGVASGTVVVVDVMRITTGAGEDAKWSRRWKQQQVELWPGDQSNVLSYDMGRKEYEKLKTKPVNLHIELGLSEYQEADARTLSIPAGKFFDEMLGICRVDAWRYSFLECLKPFHAPGLMATFDAQKFPCTGEEPSGSIQEDVVSHAWQLTSHDGFPEPYYTPISDYSIWFRPPSLLSDLDNKSQPKIKSVILCPGSEIRVARPELKRHVRIELDVPDVRLEDFVDTGGEYTVERKNSY